MWWSLLALAWAGEPEIETGSVFAPEVRIQEGPWRAAGTAFAVEHGGKPVVLTALHLAGPAGGHERQLEPVEVQYAVTLRLSDWRSHAVIQTTSNGRLLEGAELDPERLVLNGDLMAFDAGAARKKKKKKKGAVEEPAPVGLHPLPLADRCPEVGEVLTLVGPAKMQQGTVMDCRPWRLRVQTGAGFETQAISGAPWIDAEGRVVGMALGSNGALVDGLPGVTLADRLDGGPGMLPWTTEYHPQWPWTPNPWRLDLESLHESLLPAWGVSGRNEQVIRDGLASSPELTPIFDRFSKLAWESSAGHFEELAEILREWDAIYAKHGIPYRNQIAVGRGNQLAWMTVVEAGKLTDGEHSAELVVRVDQVNIAESAIAWHRDGSVQIRPRGVRDELIQRVLPELGSEPLRSEIAAAVSEGALAVLDRAAKAEDPWTVEGFEPAMGELLVHGLRTYGVVGLTPGEDAKERAIEGWTRALTDSRVQHTARILGCHDRLAWASPACKQPPAKQTTEHPVEGLPDAVRVTWGGR